MILASNGFKTFVFEEFSVNKAPLNKARLLELNGRDFSGICLETVIYPNGEGEKTNTILINPASPAKIAGDNNTLPNIKLNMADFLWYVEVNQASELFEKVQAMLYPKAAEPMPANESQAALGAFTKAPATLGDLVSPTPDKIAIIRELLRSLTPDEIQTLTNKK